MVKAEVRACPVRAEYVTPQSVLIERVQDVLFVILNAFSLGS